MFLNYLLCFSIICYVSQLYPMFLYYLLCFSIISYVSQLSPIFLNYIPFFSIISYVSQLSPMFLNYIPFFSIISYVSKFSPPFLNYLYVSQLSPMFLSYVSHSLLCFSIQFLCCFVAIKEQHILKNKWIAVINTYEKRMWICCYNWISPYFSTFFSKSNFYTVNSNGFQKFEKLFVFRFG